jgi:hypothetical protein
MRLTALRSEFRDRGDQVVGLVAFLLLGLGLLDLGLRRFRGLGFLLRLLLLHLGRLLLDRFGRPRRDFYCRLLRHNAPVYELANGRGPNA